MSFIGRGILLVGTALFVAGCSKDNAGSSLFSERDSAGARILTYHSIPPSTDKLLSFSDQPLLELGHDPDSEFFQVSGVQRLSDGGIVVANSGSLELRIYDENGRFVRSSGGEGEGPGEFRAISWIGRGPGDTLWVSDDFLGRLQVFSPEGAFVRVESLTNSPGGEFGRPDLFGILENGHLVATRTRSVPMGETGPVRTPIEVTVIDPENGSSTPILPAYGPEQIIRVTENGYGQTSYTFGSYSEFGAAAGIIAAVEAAEWGFKVFGPDGSLRYRVELPAPDVEVDRSILEAYAESSLAKWPPGVGEASRNAFRRRIMTNRHSPVLPKVRSVEVDSEGRIWIEPYSVPGTPSLPWEVFGPNGRWLFRAGIPPGFRRDTAPPVDPSADIGSDYFLGVWTDERGIEIVRLYGIGDPG